MKLLLKLVVSFIIVVVIVWQLGGVGEVGRLMVNINPLYIILIFVINTSDRALMTYKWTLLLRGRGMHLPFLRGMKIYCASMIWGMFLPATAGADAIRAYNTSKNGINSNEVIASIIIERMIGFLSALLLGLLSFILLRRLGNLKQFNYIWLTGIVMVSGAAITFSASFSERVFNFIHGYLLYRLRDLRIMQRMRELHMTYRNYQNEKGNLLRFFGLTFSEQFMPIFESWVIARGLGVEVSFLYMAGAVSLTLLISRLPISIDGIGVYDGIFMLIMSSIGVSPPQAIAITLTGRIMQTLAWLPWWIAHVIDNRSLRHPMPLIKGN